jgi:hypothetical protein
MKNIHNYKNINAKKNSGAPPVASWIRPWGPLLIISVILFSFSFPFRQLWPTILYRDDTCNISSENSATCLQVPDSDSVPVCHLLQSYLP